MERARRAPPRPVAAPPMAPLVGRPAGPPPVPLTLETLRDDHAIQRLLCDELETVADGLPDLPPPDAIRRLCDRILWITETHFARAEAIFGRLPPGCGPSPTALAALCRMHRLDEVHAQDLVAQLWKYAAGRAHCNGGHGAARAGPAAVRCAEGRSAAPMAGEVGQLAYMLRCFFDGGRRAIALKESWIAEGGAAAVRLTTARPAAGEGKGGHD